MRARVVYTGLPYVEQLQLQPFRDDGAYGWDIIDGFNLKVTPTYQICDRPADIVVGRNLSYLPLPYIAHVNKLYKTTPSEHF